MPDYTDMYILRPPKDHGDKNFFKAYAIAETADELSELNAFGSAPRNIPKATYWAELVEDSGRDVALANQPGTVRMHTYQLQRTEA